ncbi:MAG: molecular chaperone DnaK [Agrobacterium fabrum]|uniref:Molecular chaperone DnaK n=1 Tax=Agrobacterium fabrum TaxID=1176649 RepID=A0A2W5HKS6_9HYPH|nr:MAG: molecular chaperone DnaK [Agrobacterium fabrum]
MNFGSNSALDLAADRTEQERQTGIAAVARTLRGAGTVQCEDCSNDIPRERRLALPSATRCIRCQTRHEQRQRDR